MLCIAPRAAINSFNRHWIPTRNPTSTLCPQVRGLAGRDPRCPLELITIAVICVMVLEYARLGSGLPGIGHGFGILHCFE